MPLPALDYSTPLARKKFRVNLRAVAKSTVGLVVITVGIFLVGLLISYSNLNRRMVIENRSGMATGSLTIDVNGLKMQTISLAAGEVREWYETAEQLPVDATGTVKVKGSLSDGTAVDGALPYAFGNGIGDTESRVVICKGGTITFEP